MLGAVFLLTVGGVMIYSALHGQSITEVLAGVASNPLNPKGGGGGGSGGGSGGGLDASATTTAGIGALTLTGGGSPSSIIDSMVIPLAQKHGIHVTPASVALANSHHGPTVTGGRSDHNGPPNVAWAADMSNGTSPTPQMDALAADLAKQFGIHGKGSFPCASSTHDGYRFQMCYRTMIGGNHYNHVHFGVRKT